MEAINKFNSRLKNKDSLLAAGIIFLIGAAVSAVFNYFYQLSMGRMLGPLEYGILGSLFALIYIATFSTTAFNLSISKFSAELTGKQNLGAFKYLIKKSLLYTAFIGAVFFVLYLILIPFIADFMNVEDYTGFILVGLIGYLTLIFAVLSGALNGTQKFVWQNSASIASNFFKFAFAVILVYLGFGVNGALIAMLIGLIICIGLALYLFISTLKNVKAEHFDSGKIPNYLIFAFFASVIPILLITLDQVLVKHYFSSTDAGYYVAAGMIAKVIWFGSGFLVGPLFPKVASHYSQGKDTSKILVKAMVYTGVLVAIGCAAYYIMPTFIVSILYGSEYLEAVPPLIGLFGIGIAMFSLNQIMITYNLAIERKSFIWIFVAAILLEVAGIFLFHNTLEEVIKIFFAVNCFTLVAMLFYNRKEIFNF
jgi:O-antigen/teichoic acid export membrane protein